MLTKSNRGVIPSGCVAASKNATYAGPKSSHIRHQSNSLASCVALSSVFHRSGLLRKHLSRFRSKIEASSTALLTNINCVYDHDANHVVKAVVPNFLLDAARQHCWALADWQYVELWQCQSPTSRHVKMFGCGKILYVFEEIVANMLPTMFV